MSPLLLAVLFTSVGGFKTKHELQSESHAARTTAREVANLWKSKTRAALLEQPAPLMKFLNVSTLPELDLLRLAQEVRAFATATRERLLLEQKLGVDNRTRNHEMRRVLESITTARGRAQHGPLEDVLGDGDHVPTTEEVTKFGNDVKSGKIFSARIAGGHREGHAYIAESTVRLALVELLYLAASYGVATQLSAPASGAVLLAMFYLVSVLVYNDAGWNMVDAMHWSMEIPTTIGWGDMGLDYTGLKNIRPLEIWTTLHVAISAFFVTTGMQAMADEFALNSLDDVAKNNFGEMLGLDDDKMNVAASMLEWAICISVGSLFYSMMEHCTCSFGPSAVEGCQEGDKCAETGGYTMDLIDAIYMMIISATSVGYGDFAPKSFIGRALGVPLFFGTIFANNHMASSTAAVFDSIFDH